MLKKLDDQNFESFVNGSFYAAVAFYYPGLNEKDELFSVMEDFTSSYGNVASAVMDISGKIVPADFGITEEITPVIVIFKQGKPMKAVNTLSVESIAGAITPPGKNITLQ